MERTAIAQRIHDLRLGLLRELNDIHIFVSHTLPLLDKTAKEYRRIKDQNDKTFLVPSRLGMKGIAKRNAKEIAALFERFIRRDLHADLLLVCISRFESYLNDVLRVFLSEYPEKLALGLRGGESSKQIPIHIVIKSQSLPEALRAIADDRLQGVFYAEPKVYLSYFKDITGVSVTEKLFLSFAEVKATRDLIVHNSSQVNELYLRKAGNLAREKAGAIIPLDEIYFSKCISTMKSISSEIEKQVGYKYEKRQPNNALNRTRNKAPRAG